MKRFTSILLLFFISVGLYAQHKNNPRLYYRQFNNEYIKIQTRIIDYYETSIKDLDPKKTSHRYDKVLEQLEQSRTEINGTPPFREDEDLKTGYLTSLDSLINIFKRDFGRAHELGRYRLESHLALEKYYRALDSAENKVLEVFTALEETEQVFAWEHDMKLKRDEEMQKRYKKIAQFHAHLRPISLAFYKVDHAMHDFIDTVVHNKNVNLDVYFLPQMVDDLSELTEETKSLSSDYRDDELKKDLYKSLQSYLRQVQQDLKKKVKPIVASLDVEPFYTNNFRDSRVDFEFFSQDYTSLSRSFLKAREDYISGYYPD